MREARHGGPVDTLVVGDIGGDDLQEVIGVTRHEVARQDLGHLARRGLELVELVFLLPVVAWKPSSTSSLRINV